MNVPTASLDKLVTSEKQQGTNGWVGNKRAADTGSTGNQ